MAETLKNLGASLSLANLLLLAMWNEFQDLGFDYFRKLPNDYWFLPAQIMYSLLLYACIAWGIWTVTSRAQNKHLRKACLFLLYCVFLLGLETSAPHIPVIAKVYSSALTWLSPLAWWGVLVTAALTAASMWEERTRSLFRSILLFLLPLLPILLFHTLTLRVPLDEQKAFDNRPLAPLVKPSTATPRVIWIIFDEMDQALAFSARPKGLELPELDRIRAKAFYAGHAETVSLETEAAMPAFFAGKFVTKTQRKHPNDLLLTLEGESQDVLWSELPSVFSQARQQSVNTALVGFFHPYCRVLEHLTDCYWVPASFVAGQNPEYLAHLNWYQKALFYLEEPLFRSTLVSRLVSRRSVRSRQKTIFSFSKISEYAQRVLTNPEFALVVIHYPAPHPPGFYNREASAFSAAITTGYVDNLALVDKTLAELKAKLKAADLWQKTTLLITSDHPLRDWSTLDAGRGSEGLWPPGWVQPREVPFLVQFPGENQGVTYDKPFSTVLTGRLVLAILAGEVSDPKGVAEWIARNRSEEKARPNR